MVLSDAKDAVPPYRYRERGNKSRRREENKGKEIQKNRQTKRNEGEKLR